MRSIHTGLAALFILCSSSSVHADAEPPEPAVAVGAWIEVDDDGGNHGNYWNSNSTYQALIANKIYDSVDIMSICFIDTVQSNATTIPSNTNGTPTWTLNFTGAGHTQGGTAPGAPPMPAGGYTNQQYFEAIVADSRSVNEDILITVTPIWGNNTTLNRIFPDPDNPDEASAQQFAENVLAFVKGHGLNGLDIDWEGNLANSTTATQFNLIFTAIGEAFKQEEQDSGMKYLLTLSPDAWWSLDADSAALINEYFYAINFQLYYSESLPGQFEAEGVSRNLFAYGCCFENDCPATTAHAVYNDNTTNPDYGFNQYMMWRLNSANWRTEQAQQLILYGLVHPTLTGDLDGDGDVDTDDLAALHESLGICQHDVDFDGDTDIEDLLALIAGWGQVCP